MENASLLGSTSMGTWNIKINGNDTFQDVYQVFFRLYNEGQNPVAISKQIQNDFAAAFSDHDDHNNCLFGLAMAQWETKSLDPEIFNQVREIIETGKDLDLWKELGADAETLQKRKKELHLFLIQISSERQKPKRRVKPKFEFEMIHLVKAIAPDNLKTFEVNEEYVNKKYVHTSGLMMWESGGGGSVLYFKELGKNISVRWLNAQTLEITHGKDIAFSMKKEGAYFRGDDVKVIYKEL